VRARYVDDFGAQLQEQRDGLVEPLLDTGW